MTVLPLPRRVCKATGDVGLTAATERREKGRQRQRRYRENNLEKCRKKERDAQCKARRCDPEKMRERWRRDREKNREKRREASRRYHEKNREKRCEYLLRYYEKNREEMREYSRRYREKNREKVREAARVYEKRQAEILSDSYIKKNLGLCDCPPGLIEAKRAALKLHRAIKRSL
jgi:hypothetical protein